MIVYGMYPRTRTIPGTTPEPLGGDRPGYKCPWCPAEVTDGLAAALTLFERHLDTHVERGDVDVDAEGLVDVLMAAAVGRQTRTRLRIPPRVVFRTRVRGDGLCRCEARPEPHSVSVCGGPW